MPWISDGTLSSTVMPWLCTWASKPCGSWAMAFGTMSTRAPNNGAARNCHTEISKLCEAVWAITSAALSSRYGTLLNWLLSMPRCSTITPLGKPVEPEV
ncbi:hypothetical protein D3C76_1679490 [compost metagenome]